MSVRIATLVACVACMLACAGVDPQLVSPTLSPDHGTTVTHSFKGLDVPVGTGEVSTLDNGALSISYRERNIEAEAARFDAWATSNGWERATSDRVPFQRGHTYNKGDQRLVLKVNLDPFVSGDGANGGIIVNVVPR